ncbi:Crp/Fnr family transcriptional regulator [Limnothrix sp. FACHB-881]|uniref:Crp/Fnr family transcriptional regulator n=1 Tax=unclassified Limnothrix TaxID=2632864 RepID=UPI00081E5AE9|nr:MULTISPECIES: Crp/Fnr family transcriptional regulator [unclassified Limnothrix]OCQ93175.1 hypothetical protein BCR12_12715 [Limnothrix sp. P13C2]MBD2159792.1 Crp/Fnr family transcriptional regulator [Limnothrix sp. FACHB-1083]MBD2190494.1 Crp/Fnr family transcriptional regulator [Limnothrix sp. FACHB-1088]MBD2551813.1 Crp/Fnr family transcriptional regulator [Limnothrix sp. FACHB-708]MBD2589492.1 Crp/Fnr family transcriptional regulator [Limnothrix sp. FACHB-406]
MTAVASLHHPLLSKGTRLFLRRSPLPLAPDRLWQIESGVVRTLAWLDDESLVTLGLWGPGDWVGAPLSNVAHHHAECLTDVKVRSVPIGQWAPNPSDLLRRSQRTEELLAIRSYRRVEMMLLKLLDWLGQHFGRNTQNGREIDLRLTHQDFADLLGATRVTITRAFGQLERQGLVTRSLHRIVLCPDRTWHYEI